MTLFRSWMLVMPWTLFIAAADDLQRADLQLVVDPHPPRLAAVRAGRRRAARRGAAQRAMVDAAGDLASIYLALLPFSIASYAQGQAAARSAGRAGCRLAPPYSAG